MAKAAITRKQLLKEPDQFITFSGRLIAFGRDHLKPILIGTGGLVLLLLIVAIASQVANRNENRASDEVEKVIAKYSAALQDTDASTAYERVKSDFSDLFDRFGAKDAIRVARIIFGNISYDAGDADTAIAMYRQALDDVGQNASLKNIVVSGLGHSYALKENYSEAIRYFEMIADHEEKTMKAGALFNLGWLYDSSGMKEKSSAAYEQLRDAFPNSVYGGLVKEKISG